MTQTQRSQFLPAGGGIAARSGGFLLSAVIADAGDQAAKRFVEFFTATIRNKPTRKAYARVDTILLSFPHEPRIGFRLRR